MPVARNKKRQKAGDRNLGTQNAERRTLNINPEIK
jgi:hypothetical protein